MKHEEDNIQIRFMNWIRKRARDDERYKVAFHPPNGGKRGRREASRFKLMGVVPGIPDVVIPIPNESYHGLFVELKTKTGTVSKVQKEVHKILSDNGYYVTVCRSFEEAKETVIKYERNEL